MEKILTKQAANNLFREQDLFLKGVVLGCQGFEKSTADEVIRYTSQTLALFIREKGQADFPSTKRR
ncbi:MAG: hypothetical protein IH612_02910 [Desulfofustis sp.]|nr:hypothetical protein [Desulfofustis sp.]